MVALMYNAVKVLQNTCDATSTGTTARGACHVAAREAVPGSLVRLDLLDSVDQVSMLPKVLFVTHHSFEATHARKQTSDL